MTSSDPLRSGRPIWKMGILMCLIHRTGIKVNEMRHKCKSPRLLLGHGQYSLNNMILPNSGTNRFWFCSLLVDPSMGMAGVSSFPPPALMDDMVNQSWNPSPEPACGLRSLARAEILAAFISLPERDRRRNHFLALKLKGACPKGDG